MSARSAALTACTALALACGDAAPAAAPASGVAASAPAPAMPGPPSAEPAVRGPGPAPGSLPVPGGSRAMADGGALGNAGADASASIDAAAPELGAGAPAALAPLTIWLAGDSTVANGNTPCPRGWGRELAARFSDAVSVVNSAAGGRSVHTWSYEVESVMGEDGECLLARDGSGAPLLQPRWQAMLDGMRAGDYLFVQFGINDGDRSCERHVGVAAFEAALGMLARAAQERGAHPIFLTPVSSIACSGETARGSRGEYVPATMRAGEAFGVPVIDLHARSVALYQELGFCPVPGGDVSAETSGPVGEFFCDDHTHFSGAGAARIAELVSAALGEQQIPLAAYLR